MPYVLSILAVWPQRRSEVERVFRLLEELANQGDETVRSCLNVAMEEVDVPMVAPYLGPTMTEWEVDRLSWFPRSDANAHVDLSRYRERWLQEIISIGGLAKLSLPRQLSIRHRLVQEFGITGLLTPVAGPEQ